MSAKNGLISIIFTILILIAMMPMQTDEVFSESASMYELKINTTYQSYDITGDSKADKLSVTAMTQSGYISGFAININGSKVFTKYNPNTVSDSPAEEYYPTIKYVKLEDGHPFLYIHLTSYNGYYAGGWVYKYESDGMKELFKTQDLVNRLANDCPPDYDYYRPFERLDSVEGNSLMFDVGWSRDPSKHVIYNCKYQDGSFIISLNTDNESIIKEVLNSPSTEYNPELAYKLMKASKAAYGTKTDVKNYLGRVGIDNVESFKYYDDVYDSRYGKDSVAYSIGCNDTDEGRIVTIVIRGSYGSMDDNPMPPDWKSNLSIDPAMETWGFAGWHPGFEKASKEVYDKIRSMGLFDKNGTKYIITGHSRGGAVGNLLAVRLSDAGVTKENVYDYNFACPDVNRGWPSDWNPFGAHDNIFNVCYCGDLVTKIPGLALDVNIGLLGGLGWGKYGRTMYYVEKNYQDTEWDIVKAHDCDATYLRFLKEKRPFNYYKTWDQLDAREIGNHLSAIISLIKCPVDVVATDSNGNALASVINGEISFTKNNNGQVIALTDGDKKWFLAIGGADVRYKLTGTDTGTMAVESYKEDRIRNSEEVLTAFDNVALNKGKKLLLETDKGAAVVKLYVADENNIKIAEVQEDGTEKKLEPKLVLSKTSYTWNNKVHTPAVSVIIGNKPLPDQYYSVTYPKGRKKIGTYTIKVNLKKGFSGIRTASYTIVPKGTKLTGAKIQKNTVTVKWAKQTDKMPKERINGYQIQYSLKKDFKSKKTIKVAGYKKSSKKIKSLKPKKKYYFRVRTYMKSGKKTYYSTWSKPKAVKVK